MKKYLFLPALLFCLACEENAQQQTEPVQQDSLELSEPLQVETNRRVTLMPEAQQAVSEWLAYATAQHEIENMKNTTGKEIIRNSEPLLQIMENLHTSIPDSLQVNAVQARTNVLLTKAGILHQLSNKKDKEAGEIFKAANDLVVEFDNFKLQLNELFLPSPEDFELELDREFEESRQRKDSLSRVNSIQEQE